jgi:hypothetical protein
VHGAQELAQELLHHGEHVAPYGYGPILSALELSLLRAG